MEGIFLNRGEITYNKKNESSNYWNKGNTSKIWGI